MSDKATHEATRMTAPRNDKNPDVLAGTPGFDFVRQRHRQVSIDNAKYAEVAQRAR